MLVRADSVRITVTTRRQVKPRRDKGSGSLNQRADGRWQARFWLTDAEGHRKQWTVYGKTKTEVSDKMLSLRAQENNNTLIPTSSTTLKAFLAQWLRDVIVPTMRLGTVMSYRTVCKNHIEPMLGNRPIQKLTSAEIQAAFAALKLETEPRSSPMSFCERRSDELWTGVLSRGT